MQIEESAVCWSGSGFLLFVVSALLIPGRFSLHFLNLEVYFPAYLETALEVDIQSVDWKEENTLLGGLGYILYDWIESGLTIVLISINLFWGRPSAPPVLPCRSALICTLNQRKGLLALLRDEENQTETSWKMTMNYLIKVLLFK